MSPLVSHASLDPFPFVLQVMLNTDLHDPRLKKDKKVNHYSFILHRLSLEVATTPSFQIKKMTPEQLKWHYFTKQLMDAVRNKKGVRRIKVEEGIIGLKDFANGLNN